MYCGVELPLAAAALDPAHAEPASALTILHLGEHRLDAGAAPAIAGAAARGAWLALHALAPRHVLGLSSTRRRRVTQRGALLVILLGGDEQLAVFGLRRRVGFRPIAGVSHHRPKLGILADHRCDVGLSLLDHRRQLAHIIGLRAHVGGKNDLADGYHRLGVVALHPAVPRFHDAAVRIGDVGHGFGSDGGVGRVGLTAALALAADALRRSPGVHPLLLARGSVDRTALQLRLTPL